MAGEKLGLAFQVCDDILDIISSPAQLGKSIGKDQAQGKATYPKLLGIEGSMAYVRELTATAKQSLAPFAPRAKPLVELADFVADSPKRLSKN